MAQRFCPRSLVAHPPPVAAAGIFLIMAFIDRNRGHEFVTLHREEFKRRLLG